MRLFKFFVLQINGLFPFLYPIRYIFKNFNFFKGIGAYYRDYVRYIVLNRKERTPFPLHVLNAYPILFDRYEDAGEVPKHYFYMDLWAAKKVYLSKTKLHYDIGSRIDSFISHCLVFCRVVMLDVRPLKAEVPGLEFKQADCTSMSHIRSNSIQSLPTLHAIEHFGLGRYGDPMTRLGIKKQLMK